MIERVRRVVMGEPEPRRSVFTHVEEAEALDIGHGVTWWPVWGWDEVPRLPHHGAEPWAPQSFFPRPGGVRVSAIRYGAERPPETDEERRRAERGARLMNTDLCGMYDDPTRPMHRTDSIDLGVVVSGEVTLEADDGSTVVLGPGDVYVQNGAMHGIHWDPENPAHVVFIVVGAERDESTERSAHT